MSAVPPRVRRLVQLGFGVAVVAGTIAVIGTGPVVRGVLAVSPPAVALSLALTAVATLAAAWRWRVVSAGLGLPIPVGASVAAYYRSQFVNTVLPGGVLGDVHRAYRQGARDGRLIGSARAVATERVAGQVVQAGLTVAVLAVLGLTGPIAAFAGPLAALAGASAAVLGAVIAALAVAAATARGRRLLGRELSLLRQTFGSVRASVSIGAASAVVVAAHSATFVVACLAVGVVASPRELLALAVVALAAAALPLSFGGWGPREAAAAAAFAVVGLGAGAGLAASTAFGILTMVSVLPGLVVLIVEWVAARARRMPALAPAPAGVMAERSAA
jgi:uncharacterized membrane protein YbhN (UPF0104 family)